MVLWMLADRSGCGVYRCLIPALGLKDTQVTDSEFVDRTQLSVREDGTLSTEVLDGITAVVMQRPGHPVFKRWITEIQARGIPLLVEIDDDIWHIARDNPAHGYWKLRQVRDTFAVAMAKADKILVSTPQLGAQVHKHTGRKYADLVVAHNHLNDAVWGQSLLDEMPVKPDLMGRTVLGWQGSPTHNTDFRVIVPALQQVLNRYPHTVLRLFGSVPTCIREAIPANRFEWAKGVLFEEYPLMLRAMQFDIMLAPLTPTIFNESKSHIRWLEASALRVPVVASAVGPYRAIVHGETGLLAGTTAEWVEHLSALIENAPLRAAIASRAHDHCWSEWGHSRVGVWAEALKALGVTWQTATAVAS